MRRRDVIIFIALFLAAAAVPPVSAAGEETRPFDDVPAATWPYAVIDHFSTKGWVKGYDGGLYVEGRVLSRYELALMTGEILDRAARLGGWGLKPREVAWLQLLAKEYAPELELLGYRLEEGGSASPGSLTQGFVLSARTGPEDGVPTWAARLRAPNASGGGWRVGEGPLEKGSPSLSAREAPDKGPFTLSAGDVMDIKALLVGGRLNSDMADWRGPSLAVASAKPSLTVDRSILERDADPRDRGHALARAAADRTTLASLAPRHRESRAGGGIQFGARAHVSWVERAAEEWHQVSFPSPDRYAVDADELRSYDLVLHLGDVRVTADRSSWWRGNAPAPTAGSLGATGFGGTSSFHWDDRAADRTFSRDSIDGTTIASRAALDMDLFVPSARLRLGWRYESDFDRQSAFDGKTVAGVEYQLDSRASALAGIAHTAREDGTTRTTQLGLRYSLSRDSSLLLGYRLVDFTQLEEEGREDVRTKMATAEFVLRF